MRNKSSTKKMVETEGIALPPLSRPAHSAPGVEFSESGFLPALPRETPSEFPAVENSRSIPSALTLHKIKETRFG